MTRPRYAIIVFLLIYSATLIVFAHDDNFDSYCGKNFSSAQNNCPLRCASGTDKECIDILGEGYKCFNSTGCSERIKNRELIIPSGRRTAAIGGCASTLKSAVMGCGNRVSCSGDVDCAVGESCYSDIGCGNPLMELNSEFLFTMIGVQTPMDEAAESTLTQTLTTFLEPILEDSNIALDSVGIIGDPQHLGVMLDVNVKFTGLYRPPVEQNLGGIIMGAFNSGAQNAFSSSVIIQNAFISALSSQGSYFSGVVSVLLTLKENGSRPAPPPAPAPTAQIDNLPSNIPPSASVGPPPPTEFYLSVIVYNTPYQTLYMNDADFNKLAEVLISAVNIQMGNSMTIEGVTLGYHKLISLGNYGLTATEINLGYKVSTNLPASTVGDDVARAVGRSKKAVLSLLQGQSDALPYFLEVDEIQAQNIASIGDPNGAASLPNVIPQKPITQPPEEDSDVQEAETGEFTGPLVGELLASDAAKEKAEEEAAGNELAEKEAAKEQANAAADPVVKNDPGGLGSGALVGIVIVLMICFMVVLGLTYRQFEKKRRLIVEQRRKLHEEDVESDVESNKSKSSSQQNVMVRRRSSITDIESGETSMSSNDSPNNPELNRPIRRMSSNVDLEVSEIPRRNSIARRRSSLGSHHSSTKSNNSTDNSPEIPRRNSIARRRSSLGSQHSSMKGNNSEPREINDERSISSSDSDSSSASGATSGTDNSGTTSGTDNSGTTSGTDNSGTTSGTDNSGTTSGDDSSSDESDASSRKAAGTAVVRKKITRRLSLDEDMSEEIKACMHNQSLSTYQRKMKMNEIKSKYNSKKLLEEARGESFQRNLDEFLGGKRAKEKNRRITTDGIGGKPPPGLGRRRLSEVSSGRSSADRRKALTRTLSAQSLGHSGDKLNSSHHSHLLKRRSSASALSLEMNIGGERRNSFTKKKDSPDIMAHSDSNLGHQDDKLNTSSQSNSLRRRGSANDLLADSDHCIEKKKFSDMKVSQRPRHRRLSM